MKKMTAGVLVIVVLLPWFAALARADEAPKPPKDMKEPGWMLSVEEARAAVVEAFEATGGSVEKAIAERIRNAKPEREGYYDRDIMYIGLAVCNMRLGTVTVRLRSIGWEGTFEKAEDGHWKAKMKIAFEL